MEAIERVSAESLSAEVVVASFNELQRIGEEVANPEDFELPSDTAYAPDKEFRWVAGVNIVSGRKILVLEDLAISPPSAGILRQPDTNGIAAGANHLEAIVHALAEIIERDAISQHLFRELFLEKEDGLPPIRRVDPKYTDPHTKKWLKRIGDCGMQTVIEDCTTDLAVPVFRVSIVDHNFPSPSGPAMRRFLGYGCDLVSQKAISRAVTEAVQSRLATIQGARDSFNTNPLPFTVTGLRAARLDLQPGLVTKLDQLRQSDSNDLRTDLDQLVAALVEVGLPQVIAVDLTHPDLSVAVVRVRVPGLSSFLIDRSRPGWRCLRYLL